MTKAQGRTRSTPKIIRTLKFVHRFIQDNGYSPAISDVEKQFRIQYGAAFSRIDRLISLGYLQKQQGISRSLTVTDAGIAKLKTYGDWYDEQD